MGPKTTLKRTRVSENSDELSLSLGHANRSEDPLSNYVVLQNIFSYLDNTDIESCCQVNKCWNAIADPLFVRYHNVRFPRDRELWMLDPATGHYRRGYSVLVSISKLPAYDSKVAQDFKKSLNDATKFFEVASQHRKVAINFDVLWYEGEEEVAIKFLTKFGSLGTKLTVHGVVTTRKLCENLARFFPNLQVLELQNTVFMEPDDLSFDENLMANRLKRLHLIGGLYRGPVQKLKNIFRMAPNLKEIAVFPTLGADALIESGNGHCVRSLHFEASYSDEEVRIALEKLGNLELKLKSFDFRCSAGSFCNLGNPPYVRRILESSRDSLENLILHKSETFDFHAISPLKTLNLNTVQFWLPPPDQDCATKFVSPETILSTVFPKVRNVEILSYLLRYPAPHIARWFPEHQFALWGIRTLKISGPNFRVLRELSRAFPALTHLELLLETGGLHRLMRAIGEYWPDIEFLTIEVPCSRDYCAPEGRRGWSIESLLTGIPQNDFLVLHEGTGPLASESLISSKKQENWKERQPLRKLAKLKVLKYDLTRGYQWGEKFMEGLSNMTLVSEEEFGVQFPPDLKTVVWTSRHVDSENWERVLDTKANLEHFANFKLEIK